VCLRWEDPCADQHRFDVWQQEACGHGPLGQLVSHHLGNIERIGFLREFLSQRSNLFPVLLEKVLYNGTHGGDYLDTEQVARLIPELEQLQYLHSHKQEEEQILRQFEQQLRELITTSKSVGKPIVF
jgi:hypothetical protein